MICPRCGARYPRGFSQCTHCEVRLVDEPDAAGADPAAVAGTVLVCPECGGEYRYGVAQCADCEVPLVAESPAAPAEHPEPNMVKLTEVSQPALLPIVVGLLESAGIEPMVEGDEIMGLLPVGRAFAGWTGSGRGLSAVLWVPTERLEEARALLADAEERAAMEGE